MVLSSNEMGMRNWHDYGQVSNDMSDAKSGAAKEGWYRKE